MIRSYAIRHRPIADSCMTKKNRKPVRNSRRSGDETRKLVLRAAAQLFRKQGYAHTGTRDIARHAGVPERLLYRHFGTKRELFLQVVSSSLDAFLRRFIRSWDTRESQGRTLNDISLEFVDGLMQLFTTNRRLLCDLMVSDIGVTPGAGTQIDGRLFHQLLDNITEHSQREAALTSASTETLALDVRLGVALVLSMSLFSNLLFVGKPPGRKQLVAGIARFIMQASAGNSSDRRG